MAQHLSRFAAWCTSRVARLARDYLVDWIKGHFYDLEKIRPYETVLTELRTALPINAANNGKQRRAERRCRNRAG
jgi:hypothetical protein